ncbi:MAG: hypothetical protein RJB68_2159 [Pseudomonadota bacterium]|jgi:hypothetical protein
MKYTQITLAIGMMYRTARPVVSMSAQTYINAGGTFRAVDAGWTLGEQA